MGSETGNITWVASGRDGGGTRHLVEQFDVDVNPSQFRVAVGCELDVHWAHVGDLLCKRGLRGEKDEGDVR
jgi:hypothetical protein